MKGKSNNARAARFFLNLEPEILELQSELLSETYKPCPYHCFTIYEPKKRFICAAKFRDCVVHHAICSVLEPMLERCFIFDSYACRKEKGAHRAAKRAGSFCRRRRYFLKSDVSRFFASVDHEVLKGLLRRKIKDQKFLRLMDAVIDHPVPAHEPGKGLAIGNLTSQWWANMYLDRLDHYVKDELGMKCYLRYMDDFLVFSDEKERLHLVKSDIQEFLRRELKLELKKSATLVAPVLQGVPYLGFRIFPGVTRLNRKSLMRFRRKIRQNEKWYREGKIDEDRLARSAASLVGHVRHANTFRLRRDILFGSE